LHSWLGCEHNRCMETNTNPATNAIEMLSINHHGTFYTGTVVSRDGDTATILIDTRHGAMTLTGKVLS